MKSYQDLTTVAYYAALDKVAEVLNRRLKTDLTRARDWEVLEQICEDLKIRFNDDGSISEEVK